MSHSRKSRGTVARDGRREGVFWVGEEGCDPMEGRLWEVAERRKYYCNLEELELTHINMLLPDTVQIQ